MRFSPFLCLPLLLLAACGSGEAPEASRPNVVVIMIDTLRPDHLGFGGATRETAPFLAELAARGTVFDRTFSTSSWTAPATASLFTGLYPTRHGVVLGFFAHFQQEDGKPGVPEVIELRPMPRSRATLPEVFQKAGYRTFGLATNINIGPEVGFDRGFDRFERLDELPADELLGRLGKWKSEIEGDDPFFLYLHLNDVHAPYTERGPWFTPRTDRRENFAAAYDSEISFVDEVLRRLYDDYDLGSETLIVVVSDHGEEFLEHGQWDHRFTLYRELTQVLFLIHGPGVPAQRVETNVGLVDVLPTIAELAGIEAPLGNGRSLAPLMSGGADGDALLATLGDRPLFAHRLNQLRGRQAELWSVMKGGWKMIELVDEQGVSQRLLFNLNRDRFDQRPVPLDRRPEVVADLGALLDEFKARGTDIHGELETIDLDPELLKKLQGLGYTDGKHEHGR